MNSSRTVEKELYEPIKQYLEKRFGQKHGHCYLETTSEGAFSDFLKSVVPHDIIFHFLGKKASPDLTGFTFTKTPLPWYSPPSLKSSIDDLITVEIKKGKLTLQDIYQAKMYGDLFQAKYALLISPEPTPTEIRRLNEQLFVTYRYMSGWYVYIAEWSISLNEINEFTWLPHSPYED